jgi:protein gp37
MGCFKVSQGCKHCYADELTTRRMGLRVFGHPTQVPRKRTGAALWAKPASWDRQARVEMKLGTGLKRAHRVFCASLADIFEDAPGPNEWREDVWDVVRVCKHLDWQILTKRPQNIARMLPDDWANGWPHVWLGTSIESNKVVDRARALIEVPAHVHFISYEPAIGPLDHLQLHGLQWIIVGGESGPGYRPMDLDWARDMRRRCKNANVPFFFKQSAARRTEMGITLDGRIVREYPTSWDRHL